MKYAFIILIAIYLVIYGCSPDNSEKATDSHEKTAPATMENPQTGEMVAVPEHQQESAEAIEPTSEVVKVEASEQAEPVAEEQQTAQVIQEPFATKEPVSAPVVETTEQTQAIATEQASAEVAESQQIITPCGRIIAQEYIPENAPCLQPQVQEPADNPEQDLAAAMQRMAETTDEMVLATRQLVIATQEMLNAGKSVAGEAIDTGKKTVEAQEETKTVAVPAKDIVETMRDVVSAAQEIIEATNKAISAALKAKQQQ